MFAETLVSYHIISIQIPYIETFIYVLDIMSLTIIEIVFLKRYIIVRRCIIDI